MNSALPPLLRPLDAPACPLCGRANQCAAVAAGQFNVDCWCRSTPIHPDALAALPASAQGRACLCPTCAAGAFPGAAPAGTAS